MARCCLVNLIRVWELQYSTSCFLDECKIEIYNGDLHPPSLIITLVIAVSKIVPNDQLGLSTLLP